MNEEQLKEIERLVNRYIGGHYAVSKVEMPIEEAKKSGATALFDEKYGDVVRDRKSTRLNSSHRL